MTPRDVACQGLVELVTRVPRGRPAAREVAAVDQHLADCDPCLRYLDQMRATAAAPGVAPTEQVTQTLPDRTVDALLEAIRQRR
jgi:hypothetical protein